ncbi:intimin-like inverse autotransporter SinH [Salmonella enterica]|uniref:intimin-like inverse autotransporter SinH n=1 Tax=Salmonella enterica TaxID=28901 RepID=UPI0009AF45E8|nr:intimin-like inverse autotransporter SinH [Salmonella enterica]EAN4738053.1 intimin-like inverse autotransporter SinH [Salmonella enterica]EAO6223791.1 intimin-like inverse autotransporter SinH [Salmonella enterica]EAR1842551.1 intimin-like inverse autotransporter SinH [Salmonella enterica]EAS9815966.1 intimin-like inverse autotransporter SinH [Salmonella enterica]EBC0187957.1 intimin-like inverse autotransporter SinH [Salmonella enterica]
MVRRIRILVLLLVSGVSVAASGADNSVSANDESHSSLPDLASESAKKEEQENKGKTFKEQGANYFINSATQGFDNLTPEALESQARGYIQGQVTSSAQSYLEGMLSPYGKVRTSLSIGEGGDLDGSSLDYFIPWYDNQSTLFFSQISAQRKEDRTIGNVGLGVRQNVGNWLLGGNAFYDYDFTRGHRRLGLGTEAWTDYLKFSGNYYHPLSDWKDSKDFDFYEERPARGWDIRMESWLPFYPQLGAKLVYEQYYGDEVALFGTDNLQKDPHAVTVGLNYTPVPLVTVGTDYKAGTGDSNDFSVNATVNYQIGTPLAAQLDPENVKIQHSLMGSRTDFVDRNNFIVLEYREKDPLDVTLWLKADATNEHPECVIEDTPEAAVGLEKCKWTVNALINHHYKIISASWQAKNNAARTLVMPVVKADALTEGNNNRWNLVLPAWVNADTEEQRTALNTWKVRMTLEDEKGNKQNSGVVEITVQQDRKIELIVDNIADNRGADGSQFTSSSNVDGYNLGVYATWFADAQTHSGAYVDSWYQYGFYNNSVESGDAGSESYDSTANAVSLETGYRYDIALSNGNTVSLTPQAQVVWQNYSADSVKDNYGTRIDGQDSDSWTTRLGLRVDGKLYKGSRTVIQPFAEANWLHTSDDVSVSFDDATVKQDLPANRAELKVGLQADIDKQWSVRAQVAGQTGSNDFGDLNGSLNLRYNW